MATTIKTIEYAFTRRTTLTDNTLQAMTQITAYIPEFSGTVTFKKVIFYCSVKEGASMSSGNYTSRRIDVSVGGASATSYSNSFTIVSSAEQTSMYWACDATSHFVTNWTSGTSKTIDCSVLVDSAATPTINFVDVDVTFYITYEYDDTQPTQIKTVYIPLNAPTGALATTKPGTETASIPALDTELPEASKVYRDIFIVTQGNVVNTGSTTDGTLSMQIDNLTAYTSSTLEMGLTSDYWTRFVWDITSLGMTTNATHSFYLWSSIARHHHQQVYLVVTYEFDASASNDVFVSLKLPMEISSPMGTSSTIYQRATRDLWIQESTITTKQVAFYAFWDQAASISDLNMRIGTGSFVTYTDAAAVLCGSNGAMVRNDSAFTLARGLNSFNFDCYTTDANDFAFNLSGYWIINYTCAKPSGGHGQINRTVQWNLDSFTTSALVSSLLSATNPEIPNQYYFINALGANLQYFTSGSSNPAGVTLLLERLASGENGLKWEPAYVDISHTDPEIGLRQCWAQIKTLFKRWKSDSLSDPDANRMDITSSRRWRIVYANASTAISYLDLCYTYHCITYTISGTISNSGGGTVTIDLIKASTGEKLLTTTRSGNGSYSFLWFDNTEDVQVIAYESSTYKGISKKGTPNTDFDISLTAGGGSGGERFF